MLPVDVRLNDVIIMKKPHPCGGNRWTVLRIGMDFRIKCLTCGHEVMRPRRTVEKAIKSLERDGVPVDMHKGH